MPVIVKEFKTKQEELEMLLLENMYRDKTVEQKVKEAEVWEEIEKIKAEKRKISNLKQNTEGENFLTREDESQNNNIDKAIQKGRTLDIVAKQVGIGSGKTLETAKVVVKKIDELKENGDKENADFLSKALDKSISGAKKLVEKNIVAEVPKVYKDMVKEGSISVSEAYNVAKISMENKKKNEESERLYKEQLEKEKQEREEKKKLEEIQNNLPENAIVLDKFRKPEETHIFGITDFKNLSDEQFNKCLKHCKKHQEAIHKVEMLSDSLDSLMAWECILETQEEIELELKTINNAIQVLNNIRNYFKGVKKE